MPTTATNATQTATTTLARFAASIRYADLPPSTITHAKHCVRDALGCGLFGSTLDWTRMLTRTMAEIGGTGDAVVWGTSDRVAPDAATLINGTSVHSFELDDLHKTAIMHPGGVTLPGLLALADAGTHTSGQDLIAALVAGYETGIRVGLAVGLGLLHRGWHNNGVLGTFSAAAAAARLLGLDSRAMEHAIGTAATQSGGLMAAQYGSMAKRFHAGRAAQSGLYAAVLSRNGFRGIDDVFGDRYGMFLRTFSDESDPAMLTYQLGHSWEIENVGFKWYSACGSSHTSIDAALALLTQHAIVADDIAACTITASTATKDHVGWPYVPDTVTTAQMNLPFAVAVAFEHGDVGVEHFAPARLTDPRLIDLATRIRVEAAPDIDARGARFRHSIRMKVQLHDGRILEETRDHAKGSEYVPLTEAELHDKFRRLAGSALSTAAVDELEDLIERLDQLPDVTAITQLLSTSGAR